MKFLRKAGLLFLLVVRVNPSEENCRSRVLKRVVLLAVIFAATLNNVLFTMNGIIYRSKRSLRTLHWDTGKYSEINSTKPYYYS